MPISVSISRPRSRLRAFVFLAVLLASGCSSTTRQAEPFESDSKSATVSLTSVLDVPQCRRNFGTVALVEPTQQDMMLGGPSSAIPIIRLLVARSGCFKLVDRGLAAAAIGAEKNISGASAKASMLRADYLLTPQLVFQDTISNDISTSGSFSESIPPRSMGGGLNLGMSRTTTQIAVLLALTKVRTGQQIFAELGGAIKSDVQVNAFNISGFGNQMMSSKTAAVAYVHAYSKLVENLNARDAKTRRARE